MQDTKNLGGVHIEHTTYPTIVATTGFGHCPAGARVGITIIIDFPRTTVHNKNGGK
jgi:hypothetical protein